MLFGDKILKYKDELLADLNTLIGMQSIDGKGMTSVTERSSL